jgi:hypothetical protein
LPSSDEPTESRRGAGSRPCGDGLRQGKHCFFEKKQQKLLLILLPAFQPLGPKKTKVFGSFFQKLVPDLIREEPLPSV